LGAGEVARRKSGGVEREMAMCRRLCGEGRGGGGEVEYVEQP